MYRLFAHIRIKLIIVQQSPKLYKKRDNKYNELSIMSAVTLSTVYSMMDDTRKDLSVITVKKLCDGLNITITEFFSATIFDELEQELQ